MNLYGFLQNNIRHVDLLGLKVDWKEAPIDYNGDPTSPSWSKVPPNNKAAAAYHDPNGTIFPKYYKNSPTIIGSFFTRKCKLYDLHSTGRSKIFISRNINPNRRDFAAKHELEHRSNLKKLLYDFDAAATPYMIEACCTCTTAIEYYLSALWTLHLNAWYARDAKLDCRDYPLGPSKDWRCREENEYTTKVGVAVALVKDAESKIRSACGK